MSGALFLMVTHGTAGDVLPFLRIGRELAGLGHEVVLLSHAPYAGAAARAGVHFVPIDTERSYQAQQASTPRLLAVRGGADLRAYYRRHGLIAQFQRETAELLRRYRPGRTVLIGRHTSALSVLTAAEASGAPSAWVAVAPAQPMVAPVAAAYLAGGLAGDLDQVRRSFGLAPVADWARWFDSPDLVLGLWPHWFDAAGTPAPASVELTGFVLGDDGPGGVQAELPPPVAAMLGGVYRPVLVTGGTGEMLHERFYAGAIASVAATGRVGLVVAPRRELVPRVLPPGWRWERGLPFPLVLPRVAALVHHGGIGTSVRALRCGTPQIILAHGADRPDNAARLAALGLAAWAPPARWTPAHLAEPLADALAGRDRGRAAALATAESVNGGPRLAARRLERLVPRAAPTSAGVHGGEAR